MKSLIGEKKGLVEKKTKQSRDERNRENEEVKRYIEIRSGIQVTLRKLLDEMDRQRIIREEVNQKVRDLKAQREELTKSMKEIRSEVITHNLSGKRRNSRGIAKIKEAMDRLEYDLMTKQITDDDFETERKKLLDEMKAAEEQKKEMKDDVPHELKERLEKAEKEQEEAHAAVDAAALVAQSAHDLMREIQTEVVRLREEHSEAHRNAEKFRRKADKHHRKYVVGMRCIQSIDGILNSSVDELESEEQASSVEARDLMDLLMSGETLGLDDLMAFQRNN